MPDYSNRTHVYVARGRYGYKIGVSGNILKRMATLRFDTGNRPVETVKVWHRPNDARAVEYNAQQLLGHRRSHGFEWFAVSEDKAVAAVEVAITSVEAGTHKIPRGQVERERAKQLKREADARAVVLRLEMDAHNALQPQAAQGNHG